MIERLKTIREALEVAHDESLDGREFRCRQTLMDQIAALTQLEAMVGEQEPVGYYYPAATKEAFDDQMVVAQQKGDV